MERVIYKKLEGKEKAKGIIRCLFCSYRKYETKEGERRIQFYIPKPGGFYFVDQNINVGKWKV